MFKSFKLKNIIIKNRAPFDDINIELNKNINILTGINGTGKTTILTYIVDSLYELAKKEYYMDFIGKETDLYRISSDLYIKDITKKFSIVYFRYKLGDRNLDYIDIRGSISEDEYNTIINLENKIDYRNFEKNLNNNFTKTWSMIEREDIKRIFEENIIAYFPSYRFETPTYLNTTYKPKLKLDMTDRFANELLNKIECTKSIEDIANWIMDVILDKELYKNAKDKSIFLVNDKLHMLINFCIEKLFSGKFEKYKNIRIGIGTRKSGLARLSIIGDDGKVLIPSIFNMSDGELSLLCIFGEILRRFDNIFSYKDLVSRDNDNSYKVFDSGKIFGIVLIDEIDKNLHIKMQTEILPLLLKMFPNIQFILTSHSPFIPLGLENNNMPYFSFIMDTKDIRRLESLENMELYNEVYNLFIEENVNYKKKLEDFEKKLEDFKKKIKDENKIIIMTEGKTDRIHLKVALKMLAKKEDEDKDKYKDLKNNIKFYKNKENDKKGFGDKNLLQTLIHISNASKITNDDTKIIGIFDRDSFDKLKDVDKNITEKLKTAKYLNLNKNIYAFSIPLGEIENEYKTKFISIEHYYKEDDLKRKDKDGRRLYLQQEFKASGKEREEKEGIRTGIEFIINWNNRYKEIAEEQWKKYNKVVDSKVYKKDDDYGKENIALTKCDFAKLINENKKDVDFSRFKYIFDIILKIKKEIEEKAEEQKIQK